MSNTSRVCIDILRDLSANSPALGTIATVAQNYILDGKGEHAIVYLLGVMDALAVAKAIDPHHAALTALRTSRQQLKAAIPATR